MKNSKFVDITILGLVFLFLFSFFEPQFLFSLTTTTGGDTGSHFPTAVYLKEVLLPQGKIMGWDQGNYAGYPIFYHYFPLTFLLMAFLNFIIPMQIAFKIVSVLGTFLLPVFVYLAFRLLKYQFPIPIFGACFSLAFLFLEANSMWGGNIPSTLAGESSYGLSLSLMILLTGSLYRGIAEKKMIVLNACLLVLIGLSHGFTMIFSGVIALFFLFTRKDFRQNFVYLFKVFALAGLLLSFWLIPFLANLPYTTGYVVRWHIRSIFEVFPIVLIPFVFLAVVSFFLNLFDRRTVYFAYIVFAGAAFYYLAPTIGLMDVRYIPFVQLYLSIFAATFLLVFLKEIKAKQTLAFVMFLVVVLWLVPNITFIRGWIKWNYEGFEQKATWPLYKNINNYLKETGPGRVVYEHSPAHNVFGTERAFENLPYFAERDTLEGLYMQSSISSPFVFYIQSAVSKVCSGPFPQYKYTKLNLPTVIPLLKMFNVSHYIARSPEAKKQAQSVPALKLEREFEAYQIYRILPNDGSYVATLANEPVLLAADSWKRDFYEWFRREDLIDIPLVYIKSPSLDDLKRFPLQANDLFDLPRAPLILPKANIIEKIGNEEIEFSTDQLGQPHIIKISYHPNWQVEGADKIYLVSPSFMLVYPEQTKVKLYFGKTIYNYLGEILSLIGLAIIFVSGVLFFIRAKFK